MKQMILKVSDDLTEIPKGLGLLWLNAPIIGSRSYYNKILILVLSKHDILALANKLEVLEAEALEQGKPEIDFNYSVVATEDEPLNFNDFVDYMNDIVTFGSEGVVIDSKPFSDLSTIQTFAGKGWL